MYFEQSKINEKKRILSRMENLEPFHKGFSELFISGKIQNMSKSPKIITVFSILENEGKSEIAGNIAKKLKASGNSVLVLNHSNKNKTRIDFYKSTWLYKFFGYEDPRIDYSHPFLAQSEDYLSTSEYLFYTLNQEYKEVRNYRELNFTLTEEKNERLDYIIVELPNLLDFNYPSDLIANSDLALLVCRSNRLWSKADENILNNIKSLVNEKLNFIINGVEIKEVETILGELPKKRSKTRIRLKNMFRFQFYTGNHI